MTVSGLHDWKTGFALAAVGALLQAGSIWAAPPVVPHHQEKYELSSGIHANFTDEPIAAFEGRIVSPLAPWMRLFFADHNLGTSSFILLTSMQDGGHQRLDATGIEQWNGSSAFFNGQIVRIELIVGPGDEGVFFELDHIAVGEWVGPFDGGIASLCGDDDRVDSTDNRVGRLYLGGCTAWRITTGSLLTAGHCVDLDPDDGGPLLPDGVLDLSGVVEFNVPASTAGGAPVAANPNDQYAIDITPATDVVWNFDGISSTGEDWAIFAVFPNTNTGLLPHEAYGLPFRMTREVPAASDDMRITGFGIDTGADNYTNQTATGPYIAEDFDNANDISHEYQVDTMGANSGSPIIWETNGLTVGIHTNAGCDDPPTPGDGNQGTSFEVDALETAIRNFISSLAKFVDVGHPLRVAEEGTVYRPYSTVVLGVTNVSTGGVVSIVQGSYSAAAGNTFTVGEDGKSMRLEAPCGSVTIGN
ncbi:MAG: hypothetical protein L0Y44_14405 [Phycisphaerales bacterium]|nr:hypothetical protein [Phycisphaerales bacterium]MCI0631835.1 hypothetical protein [Phycisphaerales bacterium]MCI0674555.1 hypothetical protein [Phycisphaerales bacterium]